MTDLPESLNQYRLLDKLGEGGMGQVFLAEDARLMRRVAIKVLPPQLAADPERIARLEREAQVLAQLEHPNVAGIFGLEQAGETRFLVMQLAEGQTLADRLAAGALELDEALEIARQIAAGMEAAHERGIVHRDLKPGNVVVAADGSVKVLDFGLAKALGAEAGETRSPDVTASPTMLAATQAGVILGTAGYMSPEQARGKPVDKRADIWAFGCVLYEMLTGDRCYDGETVTDILAAVVTREPAWEALPVATPAPVRHLLRRCLDKDPRTRLRDIGEARIAIDAAGAERPDAPAPLPPATALAHHRFGVAVAVAAAAILGALGMWAWMPSMAPRADAHTPRILPLDLPPGRPSPAGDLYVTRGASGLVTIDLRDGAERQLPDTGSMDRWMAWSPAGEEIAYTTATQLRAVTVDGSRNRLIGDLPQVGMTRNVIGIDWGSGGRIAVALAQALFEVDARGGEFVARPAPENGLDWHYPHYLPDGERLLLTLHSLDGQSGVYVLDGDSVAEIVAPETGFNVQSAVYIDGVLFVQTEGDNAGLLAAPMSPATLQLTTDLEVLLPGMRVMGQIDNLDLVLAADDFSEGGNRLGIIDRDTGSVTEVGRAGGRMRPIEFSPDGGRILYGEFGDVWIHHLETGVDQALLFSPAPENDPNFSPDGSDVLFTRGPRDLSVVPADGSRPPEPIELPEGQAAGIIDSSVWFGLDMDWAGDRIVVGVRTQGKGDYDLLQFPLGRPEEASTVKATDASEGHPALSSDGRLLAYTSEESGRNEVYVTTFPDGAGTWRISEGGGEMPRWRGDGGELFFVWENRIYAVSTDPSNGFRFGRPSVVFEADTRIALRDFTGRTYDVSPDGARFVARVHPADDERQIRTLLVTNWRSLIEAGGVER